jgi:hypothetical protein
LRNTEQKFTGLLEEVEVHIACPVPLRKLRTISVEGAEESLNVFLEVAVHASIVVQLRSDVKRSPIILAALSRR